MNEDTSRSSILIVDDINSNIELISYILKDEYILETATNGLMALECVKENMPDLILLDVIMPGINGYQVCERLKDDERTKNIPVIFITSMDEIEDKTQGFELGAVDYITKPFDIAEVKARIQTHLALKDSREALQNQNQILEEKVKERTSQLYDTQLQIIYSLGRASEYRDNETGMHIKRISNYSYKLGCAAGMSKEESELLLHTSTMHDVGKIGIPDSILLKPGKLGPHEMEIMKTHTIIGGEMLSGHDSKQLQMAQLIAITHHEKWDGSGYPRGLKGEEIPLVGRIVGLCDVFDALISERPYKKAWPVEDAVLEIERGSGNHFDPHLVKLFKQIFNEILMIKERFSD